MTDAAPWTALSPAERETFFAAIARHRRASWRVTAACAVATALLTLVVAILMAPLLYCLIGLAFDVVNFWWPTPNLIGRLGSELNALADAPAVTAPMLLRAAAIASIPGLAWMAIATWALHRVWRASPLFSAGEVPGRPPDRTRFAEERLANVVEEMAIAAGIAVPRIVVMPGGANAAACGRDREHVTLLVGEEAMAMPRDQLQGMVAHLIGSVVDGDMAIGLRVTTTLSLFGLMARIGTSFEDQRSFRRLVTLARVFVAPASGDTLMLLGAVTDPFSDPDRPKRSDPERHQPHSNALTWREWAVMPLMGPVLLTGFLSGLVCGFFLQPLVASAWRQRKYMADAVAVQLTRDPDGLAGALAALGGRRTSLAPWAAHLAVVDDGDRGGPLGKSIVPIFPSVQRRVAALNRIGAHVRLDPRPKIPRPLMILFAGAGTIVMLLLAVVVYLLVLLSTAISGLFTMMPAGIVHALLRWLAR